MLSITFSKQESGWKNQLKPEKGRGEVIYGLIYGLIVI